MTTADALLDELAAAGRRRFDGELPDGYVLHQQKNKLWVGKTPNGDLIVKCDQREYVEDVLFATALQWPERFTA